MPAAEELTKCSSSLTSDSCGWENSVALEENSQQGAYTPTPPPRSLATCPGSTLGSTPIAVGVRGSGVQSTHNISTETSVSGRCHSEQQPARPHWSPRQSGPSPARPVCLSPHLVL